MTEADFLRTTRTFYDAIAADYFDHFRDSWAERPLDRALLAGFAELVGERPVLEVGSGPGWVTALLAGHGLAVSGVDLSPEMVAVARREYPELRFEEGSMLALDVPDGSLGGLVSWYSCIHTPPGSLPDVFAEFARVLAPGGQLLVAFQVGDEPLHLVDPFGHPVALDFRRLRPERIAELAGAAGFTETARLVREPLESESTQQAFLVFRR
ncbi:class I SAM-dependent DNA methyltransferase [Streptomyces sp. NBC_01304]|uniref:class I SAM-dependent DNA methyltransferase n=1 Tax=Streptomyces sp. NBC_01304 TaxID=2903818 RepID=UPI002E0FA681|nr:class I SAM-dependent methyltransferase [Streptomyces sp. NBC_01304]